MKKHNCFKGIFLFFAVVLSSACDNSNLSQAEIEQIIAKSKPLIKIDRFCTNLPKPSGVKFIYKQLGGNSFTVHISYRYKTTLSFPEMRDYYQEYFDKNGWQRETLWDENESFHKG